MVDFTQTLIKLACTLELVEGNGVLQRQYLLLFSFVQSFELRTKTRSTWQIASHLIVATSKTANQQPTT